MSRIRNSAVSTTGLVEKYIGTSYDIVKFVYDNLELVEEFVDELNQFNSVYYGPMSVEPTTRPDGSVMLEGDLYYSSTLNGLAVYNGSAWQILDQYITNVNVITIAAEHNTGATTVIPVNNYTPDVNHINIYDIDGKLMLSKTVDNTLGVYTETDSNTITFSTLLGIDYRVTVVIVEPINTLKPNIGTTSERYVTTVENEQNVLIPNGFTYEMGNGSLEVHLDGKLQFEGDDYIEVAPSTVSFITPIATIGTPVIFRKGTITTNTPVPDVVEEGDIITLEYAFIFQAIFDDPGQDLDEDKVYHTQNYTGPGDGYGGFYVYDSAVDKSTANGLDRLDPSVAIGSQGTGVGTGCWVRQTMLTDAMKVVFDNSGTSLAGTTTQQALVEIVGLISNNNLVKPGQITKSANAAEPGYTKLTAVSQEVDRQSGGNDTPLFTAIGTTYGAGDGSTTHNLPPIKQEIINPGTFNGYAQAFAEQTPVATGPGFSPNIAINPWTNDKYSFDTAALRKQSEGIGSFNTIDATARSTASSIQLDRNDGHIIVVADGAILISLYGTEPLIALNIWMDSGESISFAAYDQIEKVIFYAVETATTTVRIDKITMEQCYNGRKYSRRKCYI